MSRKVMIAFSILVCLGGIFAMILISQGFDTPVTTCLSAIETDMTPQELSQAINIPLVTLATVPEFINDEPSVEPAVWNPTETPDCGLRVKYFAHDDPTYPFIQITVRNPPSYAAEITGWTCFNLELESMSDTDLESFCSTQLNQSDFSVYVSVSTIYGSSGTRQLIEEFDLNIEDVK